MAAPSSSEEGLKQRIIQLFREKGTPSSDGNSVELLLKDIWRPLGVEKKPVNRILHNTPGFAKVKDSPPLWQYKLDHTQSTSVTAATSTASSSTVSDTTQSTSVDAEPDVVVKKKEVDSPSKKERLKPEVLRVLSASSVPITALQITKEIGYTTAGDVNPTLYALKDEDKVKLEDGRWTMKSNVPDASSLSAATQDLHLDSTPMKLGEKPLFTREDVYQNGRKEYRFREVLTEDVVPPRKSEACNETDVSKQPLSASAQPGPIDEEMLGVLSSLFDDPTEFDLVLKIVNMLKASGDTPLDDADIFMKLNHTTREVTKPILESLEVNGLVEKIDGDVIQWKWKRIF